LALLKQPDCDIRDIDVDCEVDQNKTLPPWLHLDMIPPPMPFCNGILNDLLVDPKGVVMLSDGTPAKLSLLFM